MIQESGYDGEGLKLLYDQGDWVIGIKNYKVANDISTLEVLEKHNLTDESFVLLEGDCSLVAKIEDSIEVKKMKKNHLYTIDKGIWHTTIMVKGTKMILIEKSNTSMENSELYRLTTQEAEHITKIICP
jgi:ureidoglycolate hydrolase